MVLIVPEQERKCPYCGSKSHTSAILCPIVDMDGERKPLSEVMRRA